mmetsp:Transcript_24765/g.53861  ORF Transcript_24765/g.53861 Transcript_24765/m.53861 type:complete len:163 (+) Transcript_24765:208-696(+)
MAAGLLLAKVPFTKLVFLAVRQAARPIAKVAMAGAEASPTFQEACARAAQLVKSDRIVMPREQAVQAGCTLLGEVVVFSVSGGLLVYEFHKAREAEQRKHEEARQAIRAEAAKAVSDLEVKVQALEARVMTQTSELQALHRREASINAQLASQASRSWLPWK